MGGSDKLKDKKQGNNSDESSRKDQAGRKPGDVKKPGSPGQREPKPQRPR